MAKELRLDGRKEPSASAPVALQPTRVDLLTGPHIRSRLEGRLTQSTIHGVEPKAPIGRIFPKNTTPNPRGTAPLGLNAQTRPSDPQRAPVDRTLLCTYTYLITTLTLTHLILTSTRNTLTSTLISTPTIYQTPPGHLLLGGGQSNTNHGLTGPHVTHSPFVLTYPAPTQLDNRTRNPALQALVTQLSLGSQPQGNQEDPSLVRNLSCDFSIAQTHNNRDPLGAEKENEQSVVRDPPRHS